MLVNFIPLLLQCLLCILIILLLSLFYTQAFSYDSEKYQHALKIIYRAQSIIYNSSEFYHMQIQLTIILQRNMNKNFKNDLNIILHPDLLVNDIYAFREYDQKNDTGRTVLVQNTFYYPENIEKGLVQFPQTSLSFSKYGYPKSGALKSHSLFKKYGHLINTVIYDRKSNFNLISKEYKQKMSTKSHQCQKDGDYSVKTYQLNQFEECIAFFNYLNSSEYQIKNTKFIIKTNSHKGDGVSLMSKIEEQQLKNNFQEGALCNRNISEDIIQEYITHPILYNGFKLDFRINIVLTQTSPIQLYLVDAMIARRCSVLYDIDNPDKLAHACNLMLQKDIAKTKDGVLDWTFQDLTEYLYKQGYIKSLSWKEEYFIPKVKSLVAHMIQSGLPYIHKDPRYWETFGVDVIIDENLDLKMIEVNTFPAFSASNPVEFKTKIVFCEMIVKLISHNVREKLKNIRKVMKNVLIPMYEKQKYLKLNDELLWLIKDAFENVPIRYDLPKAIYIEFDDILKDCL